MVALDYVARAVKDTVELILAKFLAGCAADTWREIWR